MKWQCYSVCLLACARVGQLIFFTCHLSTFSPCTFASLHLCTLAHLQFATCAVYNTCNLKHTPSPILKWRGPYLGSRVVPHLRGERGECPVIPLVHWKGVALPRQRSSRTLKTLSNCKCFYSVFSAVEWFLYLRDFFYYFDRFFNFCLRDFFNTFSKISETEI